MAYTSADLETAERHVAQGKQHIAEQEELIGRLRLNRLPTQEAEALLSTYRQVLNLHKQHRDLIQAQRAAQRVSTGLRSNVLARVSCS